MQLNQIPTQTVPGEVTALETRIAEQAVNALPVEPEPEGAFARFIAGIPQPVVWAGALFIGLSLLGGRRRRR
jgi:hypothetical protein